MSKILYLKTEVISWLVVGFMADCLTRELGQWVGCPPLGSFQGILARIFASFGENHSLTSGFPELSQCYELSKSTDPDERDEYFQLNSVT